MPTIIPPLFPSTNSPPSPSPSRTLDTDSFVAIHNHALQQIHQQHSGIAHFHQGLAQAHNSVFNPLAPLGASPIVSSTSVDSFPAHTNSTLNSTNPPIGAEVFRETSSSLPILPLPNSRGTLGVLPPLYSVPSPSHTTTTTTTTTTTIPHIPNRDDYFAALTSSEIPSPPVLAPVNDGLDHHQSYLPSAAQSQQASIFLSPPPHLPLPPQVGPSTTFNISISAPSTSSTTQITATTTSPHTQSTNTVKIELDTVTSPCTFGGHSVSNAMLSHKRSAPGTQPQGAGQHTAKRRRSSGDGKAAAGPPSSKRRNFVLGKPDDDPFKEEGDEQREDPDDELEMIDLADATELPEELRGPPKPDNRVKLSAFQCVICMDDVACLTVTHCGMPHDIYSVIYCATDTYVY
jgi:hypothetical protein